MVRPECHDAASDIGDHEAVTDVDGDDVVDDDDDDVTNIMTMFLFFFTPGLLSISGTAPKRMATSATGKIVAVGSAEVPRTSALPRL